MKRLSLLICGMLLCSTSLFAQTTESNPVIETIMARRSIRAYKDQKVESEKLQLIAKCGINAPNAVNQQKWAIRIVNTPDFINGVSEAYKKANPQMVARDKNFKNMFRNAPAIIVVAIPQGGYVEIDAGLLGENMMLAAQSLGLGTCCLGSPAGFLNDNPDAKPYLERLQLPEGYKVTYVLAVGYPDEAPQAKPRDESKIKFIE